MDRIFVTILILFLCSGLYGQQTGSEMCANGKLRQKSGLIKGLPRQTPNQHNYDIHYYGLDLKFNPTQKSIDGRVEIGLQVISDSINVVELDLKDLYQVTRIGDPENNLDFIHINDLIIIDLGRFWKSGEFTTVLVEYNGKPNSNSLKFDTRQGSPLIWSLSEPYGARDWWPCKDYPFDKADSAKIKLTVPEGLIAASNGSLEKQYTEGGFSTFEWKEKYPITSYLISVAIHPYQIEKDYFHFSENDSMELVHYIYPDHYNSVVDKYKITSEMLELFSELFGIYPFSDEKYGHAEFPTGGGMEHQTLSSMAGPYEYLIAHELAHQWWGDMITCKDFHHIWLNEGFATYAEALWAEHKYGKEAYFNNINNNIYLGEGSIYVPELTERGRIFNGNLSYNKGSWVLHMLRRIVGDETFFDILKTYGDGPRKYGVATTENFKNVCEDLSSLDLDRYFDQWIYQENHPIYSFEWDMTPQNGKFHTNLTIAQEQSQQVFEMPIDILFRFEDHDSLIVVHNDLSIQNYDFEFSDEPQALFFDPEGWILKETRNIRNTINHSNNQMSITLADNGTLGFDVPNGSGIGLIYPQTGDNILYFGSIMLGTKDGYLADTDIGTGEKDFNRKEGSELILKEESNGDLKGILNFSDNFHPDSRNIEIRQKSYTSSNQNIEDCIFLDYSITNWGEEPLDSVFFGIFLDLDIGYYLDNKVGVDSVKKLIYQENGIHFGIKALNQEQNNRPIAIRNAIDQLNESNKYEYLSGKENDFHVEENNDWSLLSSSGPFTLHAQDSLNLSFALIGGETREELLDVAKLAQSYYDQISSQLDTYKKQISADCSPNPFSEMLELNYHLPEQKEISISILDCLGNIVLDIPQRSLNSGNHQERIDLENFGSGIYIIRIKSNNEIHPIKIIKF